MKDEHGMWKYLRPKLAPHGMFTRIETGGTASGVPDVDAFIEDYGPLKIELKICKNVNDGFTLRPAQHRFMQDRIKLGDRRLWILASIDDRSISAQPRWLLIHGSSSRQLIEDKSVANWMKHAWYDHHGFLDNESIERLISEMQVV
ncbi:DNA helicase [Vibrio phage phiVC8]|uniref:Uncharacterized protein n=1 Tax=Vibrio phage phiVC8 TaxID=1076759 RepID=G3FFN2_BPVC8|nr:DNA helicase [Vibrio phage phiVC8]AEM62920.1 hypothetical protein phiVC8_p23 [Vibrio phage phiVC8]